MEVEVEVGVGVGIRCLFVLWRERCQIDESFREDEAHHLASVWMCFHTRKISSSAVVRGLSGLKVVACPAPISGALHQIKIEDGMYVESRNPTHQSKRTDWINGSVKFLRKFLVETSPNETRSRCLRLFVRSNALRCCCVNSDLILWSSETNNNGGKICCSRKFKKRFNDTIFPLPNSLTFYCIDHEI